MPKAKKQKKPKVKKQFNFDLQFADEIAKIEKKHHLISYGANEKLDKVRVHSGSLCLDLAIGGGLPRGRWVEFFGPESSGKSTFLYMILAEMVRQGVPQIDGFDIEASMKEQYFANIIGKPLNIIFGEKDDEGNWTRRPIINHYIPNFGEKAFQIMENKLALMPEIVTLKNKQYQKFPLELIKRYGIKKEQVDFVKDNCYFIEDKGFPIKYIIAIDSFGAMLPRVKREKTDNKQPGQKALMFTNNVPLVWSELMVKSGLLIGVNHTSMKIGVTHGNPETTTGGNHLKFATTIRIRVGSVKGPNAMIEAETALDGTVEQFAYASVRVYKNKTGMKGRKFTARMCIEKDGESGWGIDPLWDMLEYLKMTNQIYQRQGFITLKLPGVWENVKVKRDIFRKLVANDIDMEVTKCFLNKPEIETIVKKYEKKTMIKKIQQLLNLKETCLEQLRTGKAEKLAYGKKVNSKIEEEMEDVDEHSEE